MLALGKIDGVDAVRVAYGTSQKTDRLYPGEFVIEPTDGLAFAAAGLSYPTKFDLNRAIALPYSEEWFDVAPGAPFGQHPKMGVLHPSLMRRARAAFEASRSAGPPKRKSARPRR